MREPTNSNICTRFPPPMHARIHFFQRQDVKNLLCFHNDAWLGLRWLSSRTFPVLLHLKPFVYAKWNFIRLWQKWLVKVSKHSLNSNNSFSDTERVCFLESWVNEWMKKRQIKERLAFLPAKIHLAALIIGGVTYYAQFQDMCMQNGKKRKVFDTKLVKAIVITTATAKSTARGIYKKAGTSQPAGPYLVVQELPVRRKLVFYRCSFCSLLF